MTCSMNNGPLDFEALLADPLTRLVMASDGVTVAGLRALLERVSEARSAGGCGPDACRGGGTGLGTGDDRTSDRDVQRG